MKLTIETVLGASATAAFYPLYVAAFEPIRTRAAARHLLTAEEFEAEMADERIDKYVVWDDNGEPVALSTLTTDLAAVPWVSPEYFAARYPDRVARRAVHYLGYTLVHPDHARNGVFNLMIEAIERRCADARGVMAFDVCSYNDARSVGRRIERLGRYDGVTLSAVDVQTYYAATFDAPLPEAEIEAPRPAATVDTSLTAGAAR
ncbi:hypothetical protein [Planosporangium thailandense]|uniref:hypothetical protein n=1 Tax=Planosporangium thailandense TaxID=765197 RepID=UPI00197C329B|nr:hypothetical protein [Planosporangium thailandense]